MKWLPLIAGLILASHAGAKDPYVIALIPDQQSACTPDGSATWKATMVDWILAQRTAYLADPSTGKNVVAVAALGDMVEDTVARTQTHPECGITGLSDWATELAKVKTAGLPAITVFGNHESTPQDCPQNCWESGVFPGTLPDAESECYIAGTSNARWLEGEVNTFDDCADDYRTYFNTGYWTGNSWFDECADASAGTRYGADVNCSYVVPTFNGTDTVLIVATEWHDGGTPSCGSPTPGACPGNDPVPQDTLTEARDWVRSKMQEYAHMPAFLLTHDHMVSSAKPNQLCNKAGPTQQDREFWLNGLGDLANWVATYNGHDIQPNLSYSGSSDDPDLYRWACSTYWDAGGQGLQTLQHMANYQRINEAEHPTGTSGDGLILFVTVDEDNGTLTHESCSPPNLADAAANTDGYCRTENMFEGFTAEINLKNRRRLSGW